MHNVTDYPWEQACPFPCYRRTLGRAPIQDGDEIGNGRTTRYPVIILLLYVAHTWTGPLHVRTCGL